MANLSDEIPIAMCPDISPRVHALRDRIAEYAQVLEGVRYPQVTRAAYTGEEPFHREWLAHAAAPYFVRLARALAAWRGAVQPELVPGHLIAGTPLPRVIIGYFTGIFRWDFFLDTGLAAEHPEQRGLLDYWQAWLAARPRIDRPEAALHPDLAHALWVTGIGGHSTQDYALALAGGLNGLRARVADAQATRPALTEWLLALSATLDGVADYLRAHALALDEGARTANPVQAAEWRLMAANCHHLADGHAPASFHQAVQLFHTLFLLNGHDSPGRMDQYLWPTLQRELAQGTLTVEQAQEMLDCLYLKLAEYICYGATLGGQLAHGGDATNPLTWLSLNSIRRLRLLSPRTALRWHRGMPPALFTEAIRTIATGATFPTLINDEALIPSLQRRGVPLEHARDYTFCGCGQTIPSGRAYGGYEDLVINAVKPLTYALHDGRDERTGAQLGPHTGEAAALSEYAALETAVWRQCTTLIDLGIATSIAERRWAAEQMQDGLRSLLTHSCLERGRDWCAGGADYHEGMVDLVGFTTLTDALLAIKRLVYDEGRLTLPELVAVLDRDWAGAEELRQRCLAGVPKFGNEDPEADALLQRWLIRVNDWLLTRRTAFDGPWGMDIVGWSGAVQLGAVTGATPDGRRAGEALADCAGPAQGRDRSGITATLNSMLTLPMREVHGPLALSLRIAEDTVRTSAGQTKLAALLRNYLERGGQHVQITIAGADTLRAALRDPERYRDLIVRVGGFSAFFTQLEPTFQQDMIRRTEHAL